MSYKSRLNCPVCGEMMDEINHPEKEISGYGVALVASGCRQEHLKTSPECRNHDDWILGWDVVPVPQEEE